MKRHFTVSTFVAAHGFTLLHWHRKNRMWLPPGGHIEADEDPHQAALREAEEEAGFPVVIMPTSPPLAYASPPQLPAPVTIMVEHIPAARGEAAHQHIDLIYFARPVDNNLPVPPDGPWMWLSSAILKAREPLAWPGLEAVAIPEDVCVLGLAAIERAAQEAGARVEGRQGS
ncbi:MAG: NUDIX domain-containing protein [Dehalococcoidia bacterium]